MKTFSWMLYLCLVALLAGCGGAAGAVDDAARVGQLARNYGDDAARVGQAVMKNYGDDVARNSRLLAGSKALQDGDDYARMMSSSLDDILKNKPAGKDYDDLVKFLSSNSDEVLSRSPSTVNVRPPAVVYNTPRAQWNATQRSVHEAVKKELAFSSDEADLFLKASCWTMDYVKLYGKYPTSDYSLLYIHMEAAMQAMKPPGQGYQEFAESVEAFAKAVVGGQPSQILQAAGETAFNGLCLIAD